MEPPPISHCFLVNIGPLEALPSKAPPALSHALLCPPRASWVDARARRRGTLRQHWLIKSEPGEYAYAQLEKDGRTGWTGIRNFQARANLRAMKAGDPALYYHTGDEKAVVGVAVVRRAAFPDPTAAKGEEWDAVEVEPKQALPSPVTLAAMKADPALKGLKLLTQGRLSVVPVSPEHFKHILALGRRRAR